MPKPIKLKCLDCNVQWSFTPTGYTPVDDVHKQCIKCGAFGFVLTQTTNNQIVENYMRLQKEEVEREVPIK